MLRLLRAVQITACNLTLLLHVIMIHDESCVYAEEGYDCDGNEVCNYAAVDYLGLVRYLMNTMIPCI